MEQILSTTKKTPPTKQEKLRAFERIALRVISINQEEFSGCTIEDNTKVVAKTVIPAGSCVYQGRPLLEHNSSPLLTDTSMMICLDSLSDSKISTLYDMTKDLYPRNREEVDKFCAHKGYEYDGRVPHEKISILIRMECNGFKSLKGDKSQLFLGGSKFNHSCFPNCSFEILKGVMTVRTVRKVEVGEELTMTYFRDVLFLDKKTRKEYISNRGYFDCQCVACLSDNDEPFFKAISPDIKFFVKGSCMNCGKFKDELLNCSSCKASTYCDRDCQKNHWKHVHKKVCKRLFPNFCVCFSCSNLESIVEKLINEYDEGDKKIPMINFVENGLASEGINSFINGVSLVIRGSENCNNDSTPVVIPMK
jgi:hypothetical protein